MKVINLLILLLLVCVVTISCDSWLVIKEKRFAERNKVSGELLDMILDVINRNQRSFSNEWHPTYKIYVKFSGRSFFIFRPERYLSFIFEFKALKIVTNGIRFAITKEESDFLKARLDILLEMED